MFDTREAAARANSDYPPFEFVGMDGDTYMLPNPLTLSTETALQLNNAQRNGDDEAMVALFDALSPDAAEAIRKLPIHVTAELMQAWYEAAGEPGKQQAPSSATKGGAKRSKRTSPSAA